MHADGVRALPRLWDAAAIDRAVTWRRAVDALRRALADGLDPDAEPLRVNTPFGAGHLLSMPSTGGRYAGVKLATVAPGNSTLGHPRVHAVYVVFDATTLAPFAVLDGTALTTWRTPSVAALGVDLVAPADASHLVLFGSGPQAWGHAQALRDVRPVRTVAVVGRDATRAAALVDRLRADGFDASTATASAVGDADLVACCTSSTTPVFDGRDLAAGAVVVASGAHEPAHREVDTETVRRCGGVVVEAVAAARAEAGEVIAAEADAPTTLVTLADLVRGTAAAVPRLVDTVGMGWEDLAVATAVLDHTDHGGDQP